VIPVVVCTSRRGVFFGYVDHVPTRLSPTIALTRARLCVYWAADVRGVVGLAACGPTQGCRISPAAPQLLLEGLTALLVCSPEAAKAWEAGPWTPS
jgi:hypothetical protein